MTALTNKLAALAAEDEVFVAGARIIAQGGGAVALAAILREIDNAVLERTLEFTIGDVTVAAIVAGRRLRGLLEMSADAPEAAGVLGQTLSREEPQTLQAAGDLMRQLCATVTRVTVRSLPVQPIGTGRDAGISATGLAALWLIDLHAKPQPPVLRFISTNATAFSAYLCIVDGIVTETAGDVSPLQTIWDDQILAFRKKQKALSGKSAGAQLMCFEGALGAGTVVAIAMAGDDVCLCTFTPAQMPTLTASWQAMTGS
jgi:hypothetical protein